MAKSKCATERCDRYVKARSLCELHYDRAKAAGTLSQFRRKKVDPGATLDERLRHFGWDVVDRSWADVDTPCWEWRGGRNRSGYGKMTVGEYRNGDMKRVVPKLVTRVAYVAWVGHVPDDQVVRHRCDNPPCMNPAHLELGTRAQNSGDSVARRRTATWNRRPHKLTQDQVDSVRTRYAAGGVTQRALAAEFGVCQQLISHLTRGTRRTAATNPPIQ